MLNAKAENVDYTLSETKDFKKVETTLNRIEVLSQDITFTIAKFGNIAHVHFYGSNREALVSGTTYTLADIPQGFEPSVAVRIPEYRSRGYFEVLNTTGKINFVPLSTINPGTTLAGDVVYPLKNFGGGA